MQENGVKVFAIVSNQGGVEAGFVSGADIEAKIEYVPPGPYMIWR